MAYTKVRNVWGEKKILAPFMEKRPASVEIACLFKQSDSENCLHLKN